MTKQKPWAFIAHKDGKWAGVIAADVPPRDLKRFLGEFAGDGFSISTVYNRDEYNKMLDDMDMWQPTK